MAASAMRVGRGARGGTPARSANRRRGCAFLFRPYCNVTARIASAGTPLAIRCAIRKVNGTRLSQSGRTGENQQWTLRCFRRSGVVSGLSSSMQSKHGSRGQKDFAAQSWSRGERRAQRPVEQRQNIARAGINVRGQFDQYQCGFAAHCRVWHIKMRRFEQIKAGFANQMKSPFTVLCGATTPVGTLASCACRQFMPHSCRSPLDREGEESYCASPSDLYLRASAPDLHQFLWAEQGTPVLSSASDVYGQANAGR